MSNLIINRYGLAMVSLGFILRSCKVSSLFFVFDFCFAWSHDSHLRKWGKVEAPIVDYLSVSTIDSE